MINLIGTLYRVQFQNSANRFYLKDTDNALETQITVSGLSNDTLYYICVWCDGTTSRAGFTTTRPTKLSDFAVNDRVQFTALFDNLPAFDGLSYRSIVGIDGAYDIDVNAYYVVLSTLCLIDYEA